MAASMEGSEADCHPAQKLINAAGSGVSQTSTNDSPFDGYKPYPVQPKIDKSDPLYVEYEKQQQLCQAQNTNSAEEDPSTFDIKKATQYGCVERVTLLVEQGVDVNQVDTDGASLLHWAAINNRQEIARLFIDRGAVIDKYGGTLNSTPLHWATRQGHLPMVVLLMRAGADPTAVDGEGYQCIHLCSMFGHSKIVAYLVAKGYDVDTPDRNGMTPLMWACYRTSSMDPTRLLLTLGADVNKKDSQHGHTPLHWGLLVGNHTALTLLCKQNVDLNSLNKMGQSSLDIAQAKKNRWLIDKIKRKRLEKGFDSSGPLMQKTVYDQKFREKYMIGYPFFALWAIGWTFQMGYWWCYWWVRLALLALIFLSWRYSKQYFFDERLGITIPFGLYMATKFWMYFTWFFYTLPYIESTLVHLAFSINTTCIMYYFYMSVKADPGYLMPTRKQQFQTILELAETETLKVEQFCNTCILRKPLRSKHCSTCDKCVAMFDHHCPWIFNCVGAGNIRYFVLYLTSLIGMILWCIYGCITYWYGGCEMVAWTFHDVSHAIHCSPWVAWILLNCCVHLVFVGALLANMIYQVAYLGITTNERINLYRYPHFKKDGKFHNPFGRGFIHNLVDTMGFTCWGLCRPSRTDWRTTYTMEASQEYV